MGRPSYPLPTPLSPVTKVSKKGVLLFVTNEKRMTQKAWCLAPAADVTTGPVCVTTEPDSVCVCVCVCVCVLVAQLCLTLFVTVWTVACQTPLSMGFSRQEHWSGFPCPPPGNLPDPGIEPVSLTSPALTGGFFTLVPPGKPYILA